MTSTQKITSFIILTAIGIIFRIFVHIGPNVEFVTTATILSGLYLGSPYFFIVPLVVMFVSDTIIGNTNIYIFTWSAYVVIGLVSLSTQKFFHKSKFKVFGITILSFLSVLFFYFWTNFGVWYLDQWGMYPRSLSGLIQAYVMGLPFLKYQMLGNLFFTPISTVIFEIYLRFIKIKVYSKPNNIIEIES
jgi:hypothetical protein